MADARARSAAARMGSPSADEWRAAGKVGVGEAPPRSMKRRLSKARRREAVSPLSSAGVMRGAGAQAAAPPPEEDKVAAAPPPPFPPRPPPPTSSSGKTLARPSCTPACHAP